MRDPVELDAMLERQAARMDFFQVLRLVENAHPELPRIGSALRPGDDALRLGQDAELVFHPGALAGYRRVGRAGRARLAVNFFGLLGANGPLPLHLTEYVRDRLRQGGDGTLLAFLDVFHHRLLSLFYRARAVAEPVINLDRADRDRFSDYVGSLFGIGDPALRGRDGIGDFAKLHFAGLLARRTRPAGGLLTILRAYFGLPVRLEQFVGHWMDLPADAHSRIGGAESGNRMGRTLVLGTRVWDCQHKFRLVFGPLKLADYERMLPGGASMRRLQDWVHGYCGLHLAWEVRLVLEKEQRPGLALGGGTRLGWSTWVASRDAPRDSDQLLLRPRRQDPHRPRRQPAE